jgi:integrase
MRHLRSVYNFLASTIDDLPPNPVLILTQARIWTPEKRRQRLIPSYALPAWYEAVMAEGPLARDYLLLALLTGMRRREIAGLRWENIDLKGRILTVPRTKNGDPLVLPLSSYLARLLAERKLQVGISPWVFPTQSASGHLQECKSFVRRVAARSCVEFSLHDLRRTFITVAESLDIPTYALKRLLNHRGSGDVTSGYIIMDVERLRQPVERIASKILDLATQGPEVATA